MNLDLCIPTYNARDKLQQCVESVFAHTDLSGVRFTIINDGSSDNTAEYLSELKRKHPDINVINLDKNYFKCRPLNIALQQSKAEFMVFLDDDTEVTPGWLDGLKKPIMHRPAVGMVGAKILFPDNRIFACEHRLPARHSIGAPEIDRGQRDYIRECDALVGTCYIMRTELLDTVGEYDEALKWHEDIDYSTRARLKGYKLIYNGFVSVYHHHLNRESGDPAKNLKQFDDKWAGTIGSFPLEDSHIADKLFAKAIAAYERNNWEEALGWYQKLEAENKNFCEPYMTGKCLFELGRLNEAIPYLIDERERIPDNTKARNMLIQAYKKLGEQEKLRDEANSMLAMMPSIIPRLKNNKL